MKQLCVLAILLVTATSLAAKDLVIARQHMKITRGGEPATLTELLINGDTETLVTLLETRDGSRFVFRQTTDDATKTTTFSIHDVASGEFIRGSYVLNYNGTRQARLALQASDYDVPFSVTTPTFGATAKQEHWHGGQGTQSRNDLRKHLSPSFLERATRLSKMAAQAGSPAAKVTCHFLTTLLTDDNPGCRRDKNIIVEPLADDCTFDAHYGFPCAEIH